MFDCSNELISQFQSLYLTLGVLFIILGFDDLILDIFATTKSIGPTLLNPDQMKKIKSLEEKKIAITIPTWNESGIISRMVQGNISHIDYQSYEFFIGVYPNDPETVLEARHLSNTYKNVNLVINPIDGPTTKAQMLNCVVNDVLNSGRSFSAIQMQDAEDLIHPLALKLVNSELEHADFIQTPVLSLQNSWAEFVGSTYMDEFSEAHCKDLLVRAHLGAAIPSAGVGTTISLKILEQFKKWKISLFNEESLTEDYELGIICQLAGFKSSFACYHLNVEDGQKNDFLATREYFPSRLLTAIRQKTRWNIGIALQAWKKLGWRGNLFNRYFLYRDRKGPINSLVVACGYCLLLLTILASSLYGGKGCHNIRFIDQVFLPPYLKTLAGINLTLMINRGFQRHKYVVAVYGAKTLPFVFLRVPIGSFINACAAFSAISQYILASVFGRKLSWNKTPHRLPEQFGSSHTIGRKYGPT